MAATTIASSREYASPQDRHAAADALKFMYCQTQPVQNFDAAKTAEFKDLLAGVYGSLRYDKQSVALVNNSRGRIISAEQILVPTRAEQASRSGSNIKMLPGSSRADACIVAGENGKDPDLLYPEYAEQAVYLATMFISVYAWLAAEAAGAAASKLRYDKWKMEGLYTAAAFVIGGEASLIMKGKPTQFSRMASRFGKKELAVSTVAVYKDEEKVALEVLGLFKGAKPAKEEIRKAWSDKALELHPDKAEAKALLLYPEFKTYDGPRKMVIIMNLKKEMNAQMQVVNKAKEVLYKAYNYK